MGKNDCGRNVHVFSNERAHLSRNMFLSSPLTGLFENLPNEAQMGIPSSKCHALLMPHSYLLSDHRRESFIVALRGPREREEAPFPPLRHNPPQSHQHAATTDRQIKGREIKVVLLFSSLWARASERAHRSFDCAAGRRE